MLLLISCVSVLLLFSPSKACDSIEVMICSSELSIFGSFVKEDGSPDVEAICGRQAQFGPLADNCEAQARICNDDAKLASITSSRQAYASAVETHCKAAAQPESVPQEVIEEEIVPEYVSYNRCTLNPTRLFEVCRGAATNSEQTCHNLGQIKACVRAFAPASGCSPAEMKRLERELVQTLTNIC